MMAVDYAKLPTERANRRSRTLDRLPLSRLVALIQAEDERAARAVRGVKGPLARAVRWVAASLGAGGRLIYAGAGSSGRLAAMDAAECVPTFGTDPEQVVAVVAGGPRALSGPVEGAEDRARDAQSAIRRLRVAPKDVVCAICASGVTPFALAALRVARRRRARTVLVTCAPRPEHRRLADLIIAPRVGPEILAGSTRMKAGLATQMILHTITTGAMVRLGKVYRNRMIDLRPTSRKLRARAIRMVVELTGRNTRGAGRLLARAGHRPVVALVMHRLGVTRSEAESLLVRRRGPLYRLLESRPRAR